jgi:hypothetical protein
VLSPSASAGASPGITGEIMFKALTAAALFSLSLPASAAPDRPVTLTTGMMQVPVHLGALHQCSALNVSATPLTVTLEFVNVAGGVSATHTQALSPGGSALIYSDGTYGPGFCRFTFQGAAASVRASICNWQNFSCVSHLEAR